MPDLYFTVRNYAHADRNNLDKEVREFVEANFHHTLLTKKQLKELYAEVCRHITNTLNPKFKAVKKKIEPSGLRFYDTTCNMNFHEGLHFIAYRMKNNQLENLPEGEIKLIFLKSFLNPMS